MKKSFEDRLIELSGPAELKTAKALLKGGRLAGAWRDREGWLRGRFSLPEGMIECRVRTGTDPCAFCSCRRQPEEKLCAHAIALILHAGRYKLQLSHSVQEEEASYYGGLRQESLPKLGNRGNRHLASLSIDAISAFPHVPSKWENAALAVKLRTAEREYLGNLNNLRQLYFDKSLTVTLKLEHFSLHEQQIIRFLAINGEADNSQILLNSELTAEFFHCLVDFPRFFRDGRQLKVRGDSTEAVLIVVPGGRAPQMSPGIRVAGESVLSTAGAKVITGKAGCWIGREGEYFFVPATCEISWLRNFFRSSVQGPPAGEDFSEFLRRFPLPVVERDTFEIHRRDPGLLLGGELETPEEFLLRIDYLYPAEERIARLAPGTGRLVREKDRFWRRGEAYEHEFETGLEMFGFRREENAFRLSGRDRIGTFLDQALPEFLATRPGIALSGKLAAGLRGAAGLPELQLRCRLAERLDDGWRIRYELSGGGIPADWKNCAETVKSGSGFLTLPEAGMVKIPPALRSFFPAAPRAIRKLDPAGCSFEVPFYAAGYFTYLVREIPGALIPELATGPETDDAMFNSAPEFRFEGELRNYQREGVQFLQYMCDRNFNVILADEMGLGKTVQLLALLASRKRRNDPPALIVCPASLTDNWAREAARFVPEFRVAAPRDGVKRAEIWRELPNFDLVILSYAAARLSAEKLRHTSFSFLVLDEAQHIKNPGSSNAKNCKNIHARHRLVLTGTPLENTPEDLWSIFDFLQPGMLGSLAAFRRTYADLREHPELQQDLAVRVGPFIKRRTKAAVAADLPPKLERAIYCEMEPAQRALYEEIRETGLRELAACKTGDIRSHATIFTTLLRLRQVCCHPALLPDHRGDGVPSAKMELLLELLHEHLDSNHKVLMFSQFTSLLALAMPELKAAGIPFEYLDGATRNRQQRVDHFNNDPAIPLFLLSLKAGGTGLNLTSADTVIIYDPWWNPAVELQAADRTHRIGQTRPVSSLKLVVRDSIEEKILELQERKQAIFDSVIDNPDAETAGLSIEDLRMLLGE